jgi:HK97 family phage major capsid protein
MDKKEELKGLLKEVITESVGPEIEKIKAEAEAQKEANAKLLEVNKELKAQYDAWQGKAFELKQNTGTHKYIFKGYDVNRPARNFIMDIDKKMGDEVAANIRKTLAMGSTGAYAIPVEYSNALLGLAELTSTALSKCQIYTLNTNSLKIPLKVQGATVDAQGFGTANAAAATALGQLTFTIDKRIGGYETLYNDVLADQMFDVVGQFVEPQIAQAIGVNIDGEVIKKTEFTTDITAGGKASVTVSGSVALAAAITYANLVTMSCDVELERGVSPEWYMPRGALKDVIGLVAATTGTPIFNPIPISAGHGGSLLGYPVNVMPALTNAAGNGAIRMFFGDMKKYIIAINGGMVFQTNPFVSMKEGLTQFIGYIRADGNIVDVGAFATMKRVDA